MINNENALKLSNDLLKNNSWKKDDYILACEVLEYHNELYYKKESPIISDKEYDDLFNKLKFFENKNPKIISKNSPTQNLINQLEEDNKFIKRKHLSPMISLDNTYNKEELQKFFERVMKETGDFPEIVVQTKLDGLGISLLYEKGKLIQCVTRGNGIEGEDVTHTVTTIKSIPHTLKGKNIPDKIEIRGEILMPKKSFQELNKKRIENGEAIFANPRNAASGSIRQLDANITKERNLIFFAYHIGYSSDDDFKTTTEQYEFFKNTGLPIDPMHGPFKDFDDVWKSLNNIYEKRSILEYEIDGAVIKLNELKWWKELGQTAHHPRYAIAYKFPAEQTITVLKDVVWQVGRTGVLTPRAFLEPVFLSGVTVSHATLHNKDEIIDKDFRIGDHVLIERAGDVIPHLIKPIIEKRSGNEQKIKLPEICPSCSEKVFIEEGEVALRCINESCPDQIQRHMEHFVSKQALNIENISEKTIEDLLERKMIKSPLDIYKVSKEEWLSLPLHKEKKVKNILEALENSKKSETWRILHALGIHHVGKKMAQVLAINFDLIEKIINELSEKQNISEDLLHKLQEIPDIGPETATAIINFFSLKKNRELINEFKNLGFEIKVHKKEIKEGFFTGKTVVLTGELPNYSREEATSIIESQGGKVTGSVTKNTDYLLLGENPGSKYEKALELQVEIIGEEKLMN